MACVGGSLASVSGARASAVEQHKTTPMVCLLGQQQGGTQWQRPSSVAFGRVTVLLPIKQMDWVELAELPIELRRRVFLYAFDGTPSARALRAHPVFVNGEEGELWRASFRSVWVHNEMTADGHWCKHRGWLFALPTRNVHHFFGVTTKEDKQAFFPPCRLPW